MNIYKFLSYIILGITGGFLGYLEFGLSSWEYWTFLGLIVTYGALNKLDVYQEKAEC